MCLVMHVTRFLVPHALLNVLTNKGATKNGNVEKFLDNLTLKKVNVSNTTTVNVNFRQPCCPDKIVQEYIFW